MVKVTLLGTSAGLPNKRHNTCGLAMQFDSGACLLYDCPENTIQILDSLRIANNSIRVIVISHVHLDHCGGLAALLSATTMLTRRCDKLEPIIVYTPPGLEAMVRAMCDFTDSSLSDSISFVEYRTDMYFTKIPIPMLDATASITFVHHLHRVPSTGLVIELGPQVHFHATAAIDAGVPILGGYLKQLGAGKDVVVEGREYLSSQYQRLSPARIALFMQDNIAVPKSIIDLALETCHESSDHQCIAKTLHTLLLRPHCVDTVACIQETKPLTSALTNDLQTDSDELSFYTDESLRKLNDTYEYLEKNCQGCDLMYHECTFRDDLVSKAFLGGHTTISMLGSLVGIVRPKKLIINHLSNRYENKHQSPILTLRQAGLQFSDSAAASGCALVDEWWKQQVDVTVAFGDDGGYATF